MDNVALNLLNEVPYSGGKAWNVASKRFSREIYTRDKIIVSWNVRKSESGYLFNGEQIEPSSKQAVRGLSIRKDVKIDLDKLLGDD